MAEFLSPAWLTELDAIARRSRALVALGQEHTLGVEQRVTGTPSGDVAYHLVVDAEGARIGPGATPHPDLVITMNYPTARLLHQGASNMQRALAEGGAKISGDLVRLRDHAALLTMLGDVFAEVRTTTTFAEAMSGPHPAAEQANFEPGS